MEISSGEWVVFSVEIKGESRFYMRALRFIYICSIQYSNKNISVYLIKKSCSELTLRVVLNDYRLNQTATLLIGESIQLEL